MNYCGLFATIAIISVSPAFAFAQGEAPPTLSQESLFRMIFDQGKKLSKEVGTDPGAFDRLNDDDKRTLISHWEGTYRKNPNAKWGLLYAAGIKNEQIKQSATFALGRIGDPSLAQPLLELLASGKGQAPIVIWALGKVKATGAVPAILKFLETERHSYAIDALGDIGDSSAIPILKTLLEDKNDETFANSARALAQLGDASGADAAASKLEMHLNGKTGFARNDVELCELLGLVGKQSHLPVLRGVLKSAGGRTDGKAAAKAIIKVMDREGLKLKDWRKADDDKWLALNNFVGGGPLLWADATAEEIKARDAAYAGLERVLGETKDAILEGLMRDSNIRLSQAAIWTATEAFDPNESKAVLKRVAKNGEGERAEWCNQRLSLVKEYQAQGKLYSLLYGWRSRK